MSVNSKKRRYGWTRRSQIIQGLELWATKLIRIERNIEKKIEKAYLKKIIFKPRIF